MGGHTGLIAQRLTTGLVIANDRDAESLELARANTAPWAERIRYRQGTFSELRATVEAEGFQKVDGLLADLGVSRYQLAESPHRGFSFLTDGPLDMRMSQDTGMTAAESGQFHSRKGYRRPDLSVRRRKGGAEDSQSNRPSTAHTEHTASGRCGVAGRAPDGPLAPGHEDFHGLAPSGQRRTWGTRPVARNRPGFIEGAAAGWWSSVSCRAKTG